MIKTWPFVLMLVVLSATLTYAFMKDYYHKHNNITISDTTMDGSNVTISQTDGDHAVVIGDLINDSVNPNYSYGSSPGNIKNPDVGIISGESSWVIGLRDLRQELRQKGLNHNQVISVFSWLDSLPIFVTASNVRVYIKNGTVHVEESK